MKYYSTQDVINYASANSLWLSSIDAVRLEKENETLHRRVDALTANEPKAPLYGEHLLSGNPLYDRLDRIIELLKDGRR